MRCAAPARSLTCGLAAVMCALIVAACASGDDAPSEHPSRRECVALRDRMIEVRLSDVHVDRDEHRAALAAGLGDDFVTQCADTMTRAHVRCAQHAVDAAALAACASK